MKEVFIDSLYDAVVDCLKVLPILFLAYLLVSYLSHDHSHKFSKFLSKSRKTSVIYASFLGCVPQCGFSSVIADLYSKTKVSLGTLIAVFIATSDEAIPIMLTNRNSVLSMLLLIGVKVVLALFWGFAIDGAIALLTKLKKRKAQEHIEEEHTEAEHHCEHSEAHTEHHHHHACGHIHGDDCS